MKIRILQAHPRAEGGYYEPGSEHEFPDDVARRWIAAGMAEVVSQKKATAKESTDAD